MKVKATITKNNRSNHYSLSKKGQGIIDYVFLLAVVIAILLIMGYYVRGSISGKYREGADTLGKGEVYRPNVDGVANPTDVNFSATNSQ